MRYACLLLFLCLSCTRMEYKSGDRMPIYVSAKKRHKHQVEVQGVKKFYLWGMVPKVHEVKIDELMDDRGMVSAANIRVTEYQTWNDKITSFISFGMLVPISYKVSAFGQREEN